MALASTIVFWVFLIVIAWVFTAALIKMRNATIARAFDERMSYQRYCKAWYRIFAALLMAMIVDAIALVVGVLLAYLASLTLNAPLLWVIQTASAVLFILWTAIGFRGDDVYNSVVYAPCGEHRRMLTALCHS